jgi:RNA-binding protein 5/10
LFSGAKVQLPASYTLDPTSGYYYNSVTGLYYDPQSGYYYNSSTGQYCYHDAVNNKYVPIVSNTQAAEPPAEGKKKKKEKEAVTGPSSAKKIMKDMERWAKKQEKQKKILTQSSEVAEQEEGDSEVEAEAVKPGMGLSFSFSSQSSSKISSNLMEDLSEEKPSLSTAALDIETEITPLADESSASYIDWANLTCLLCKRKFASKEQLSKHQEFSGLHKQNLQKQQQQSTPQEMKYRDRAKERRDRYGAIDPIIPSWKQQYDKEKLKKKKKNEEEEEYTPTVIPEQAAPVGQGKGSQLLQAMGWSEGQGLGRNNQGITAPIKADGRQSTTGLGGKALQYDLTGAHTYLSAVKRMTVARFKDIEEN